MALLAAATEDEPEAPAEAALEPPVVPESSEPVGVAVSVPGGVMYVRMGRTTETVVFSETKEVVSNDEEPGGVIYVLMGWMWVTVVLTGVRADIVDECLL